MTVTLSALGAGVAMGGIVFLYAWTANPRNRPNEESDMEDVVGKPKPGRGIALPKPFSARQLAQAIADVTGEAVAWDNRDTGDLVHHRIAPRGPRHVI